jgi:hypothetical protein
MHPGLQALAGPIKTRHDLASLLRPNRLGAAGIVDWTQTYPATVGGSSTLLDGMGIS